MCIITPTIAAWAIGSSIAAKTATDIYGARSASKYNTRALATEERTNAAALAQQKVEAEAAAAEAKAIREQDAAIMREKMAANEKARLDALAMDRERYGAYVQANQPYWSVGQGAFKNLADLAGIGTSGMSAANFTGGAPSAVPSGGATFSGSSASSVAPRVSPTSAAPAMPADAGRARAANAVSGIRSRMMPMPQSGGSLMDLIKQMALSGQLGGQTPTAKGSLPFMGWA